MMPDKISVIIVTFNAKASIQRAIASVNNQQYPQLELIIVDGASTDGTVELLQQLASANTRWISEPDSGIYDAMNKGIKMATGTWLYFLGADDCLCDGIIKSLFSKDIDPSLNLLYGRVIINSTSRRFGGQTSFNKLVAQNIPHQAILYRKSLLEKLGGYNTRYPILADYDLNLKIFDQNVEQTQFVDLDIALFNSKGVSNRTIDVLFFSDWLENMTSRQGVSRTDPRLAKYYFFLGVANVLNKHYKIGFNRLLHPLMFGERRFYHALLIVHFLGTLAGFGKRYQLRQ